MKTCSQVIVLHSYCLYVSGDMVVSRYIYILGGFFFYLMCMFYNDLILKPQNAKGKTRHIDKALPTLATYKPMALCRHVASEAVSFPMIMFIQMAVECLLGNYCRILSYCSSSC